MDSMLMIELYPTGYYLYFNVEGVASEIPEASKCTNVHKHNLLDILKEALVEALPYGKIGVIKISDRCYLSPNL